MLPRQRQEEVSRGGRAPKSKVHAAPTPGTSALKYRAATAARGNAERPGCSRGTHGNHWNRPCRSGSGQSRLLVPAAAARYLLALRSGGESLEHLRFKGTSPPGRVGTVLSNGPSHRTGLVGPHPALRSAGVRHVCRSPAPVFIDTRSYLHCNVSCVEAMPMLRFQAVHRSKTEVSP